MIITLCTMVDIGRECYKVMEGYRHEYWKGIVQGHAMLVDKSLMMILFNV